MQQQDTFGPTQGLFINEEMVSHRFKRLLQIYGPEKAQKIYDTWALVFSEFPGWPHTRDLLEDALDDYLHPNKKGELPPELRTQEAMKYWDQLEEAGFTDSNKQLCPTTSRQQAWYIAELFAEKLNLKNSKWKVFQDLWSMKNLAQEKQRAQERGLLPKFHKEIDAIFDD